MQIPGSRATLLDPHLWEPERALGWLRGALENQWQTEEGDGRLQGKECPPPGAPSSPLGTVSSQSLKDFRNSTIYNEAGKWLTISKWELRINNLMCRLLCTEEPCASNIY